MKEKIYPVVTLSDIALFPEILISLDIRRPESIAAIEFALSNDTYSEQGEILLKPQIDFLAPQDIVKLEDETAIGVVGFIVKTDRDTENERIKIVIGGVKRVRIKDLYFDEKENIVFAKVSDIKKTKNINEDEANAVYSIIKEKADFILRSHHKKEDELERIANWEVNTENLSQAIDYVAMHLDLALAENIKILNEINPLKRAHILLEIINVMAARNKIRETILERTRKQIDKNQQEYFLNEQLRAIQSELNEINEDNDEIESFRKQIISAKMPEEVEKKALNELNKFKLMANNSSEANVYRLYMEWLIKFPWNKNKKVNYDLKNAEIILNNDHYGLDEVKERILEYLTVQKRNPNSKAPILCFVGPPGVGKTSLGKSIAAAMGRDFERISLGGMHDEAEIRGHRRTYIGSQPGKIVQRLCALGSNNPVILLDEIDKIGHDHRGDPADALLEVLDPSQNHNFNDHFLEVNVDLSKVMFIATANTLDIPSALLDRMEVIRISGYTTREKEEIAKRYIFPRSLDDNALNTKELKLEKNVINEVIEHYTREAGVRNLEREINKLARKAVRKIEQTGKAVKVTQKNLSDFLGVPKFQRSEDDLSNKVGVITGLAWTSVGGELLQIEALTFKGKGKLSYTGQLGDVMRESVETAFSVVRHHLSSINSDFNFETQDIHLHLPEGAVPKDGPSAGIAMATVILSALENKAIRGDIAMTGEISLQGNVLPIGGLKEKLLAAVRGNIKTVLIPYENVKDLRDIPEEVINSLEIIPIKKIGEVFRKSFI